MGLDSNPVGCETLPHFMFAGPLEDRARSVHSWLCGSRAAGLVLALFWVELCPHLAGYPNWLLGGWGGLARGWCWSLICGAMPLHGWLCGPKGQRDTGLVLVHWRGGKPLTQRSGRIPKCCLQELVFTWWNDFQKWLLTTSPSPVGVSVCLWPLWETLQDQQLGLTQSSQTIVSMLGLRVCEILCILLKSKISVPSALWVSHMQDLLVFKARLSRGSYPKCRMSGWGNSICGFISCFLGWTSAVVIFLLCVGHWPGGSGSWPYCISTPPTFLLLAPSLCF